MICFCNFCTKKQFLFWVSSILTPFLCKFEPKITIFGGFTIFFRNAGLQLKLLILSTSLNSLSPFPRLGQRMQRVLCLILYSLVFLVCLSCFENLSCYKNIEHLTLSKNKYHFWKACQGALTKNFVMLGGFQPLRRWGSLSESVKNEKPGKTFFQIMLNEVLKICEE